MKKHILKRIAVQVDLCLYVDRNNVTCVCIKYRTAYGNNTVYTSKHIAYIHIHMKKCRNKYLDVFTFYENNNAFIFCTCLKPRYPKKHKVLASIVLTHTSGKPVLVMDGKNVFMTGEAGAGKSFLLDHMRKNLSAKVSVCGPTRKAAALSQISTT